MMYVGRLSSDVLLLIWSICRDCCESGGGGDGGGGPDWYVWPVSGTSSGGMVICCWSISGVLDLADSGEFQCCLPWLQVSGR